MRQSRRFGIASVLIVLAIAAGVLPWSAAARGQKQGVFGGRQQGRPETSRKITKARPGPSATAMARLLHWNGVAVDMSGLDHTPAGPGETRTAGEQPGPGRASRAMAIVHIAIYDAVNSILDDSQTYSRLPAAPAGASVDAAMAQAAYDTLSVLFPSQADAVREELTTDLANIPDAGKQEGIEAGHRAAEAILASRASDGSQHAEPMVGVDFMTIDEPGKWQQDPVSAIPVALGAHWGEVTPFVLRSSDQFRVPPPPALDSAEYAAAVDEVKRLGGNGVDTPTERTNEQAFIGTYWAYDGTPSLCAPPRLYNQIATTIAEQMNTDFAGVVRLLALIHVAMADAGIGSWESKFHYQFWRPVTGIRSADDPTFTPLGAPASNLIGPDFTPPFPSYPSGHATFGGTLFEILREFYGTDDISFTFVSDEFNGVNTDRTGAVRPLLPRTFANLSEAEEENGQSRIYLGIHWAFDKTAGIEQGRQIARYVMQHALRERNNER